MAPAGAAGGAAPNPAALDIVVWAMLVDAVPTIGAAPGAAPMPVGIAAGTGAIPIGMVAVIGATELWP